MDRATYDLLTLLAAWFSALGTVGAVVVSLALSVRRQKPDLAISCSVTRLVTMGRTFGEAPTYVQVGAVNVGTRDATVSGIQWRLGFWKKAYFVQIASDHPLSTKLPAKLSPGEGLTILFPQPEFAQNCWTIRKALESRRFRWIAERSLRVGVWVLGGYSFWARPNAAAARLVVRRPSETLTSS